METVHENKDIKELERKLGVDSIELFIQYFRKDYEMIDEMIDYKPWEKLDLTEEQQKLYEAAQISIDDHLKHLKIEDNKKQEQSLLK